MAASPYIGEIRIFGFSFPPAGWALCNGQSLPIAQYTALYSLIGTIYGGDGVNNFNLPDLQSRVPLGQGQGAGLSPYTVGEDTGSENVTLLYNNMPAHTHVVNASTNSGNASSPNGAFLAIPSASPRGTAVAPYYNGNPPNAALAANTIGAAGGNIPFSVLQPLLCVNFCIALTGLFPTRG